MSKHEVLVRRITITPHPNAELLELGGVDDYEVVVQKGLYVTGDLIAYIPEGSTLPAELVAEMGLEGKLGSGNRVKAVRLRGCLSQGLCYPAREGWVEGQNVAEELGVTKWTPEVPKTLAGNVYHLGEVWTVDYDLENIKRWPNLLEEGEEVVMTEKVHGTFVQFILMAQRPLETRGFAASSKGVGAKGNALKLDDPVNAHNLYVRAAAELHMRERMGVAFAGNVCSVVVCGELFGPGVQDLTYGVPRQGEDVEGEGRGFRFRVFDIYLGDRERGRFLDDAELDAACEALALKRVPVLYRGPYSKARLIELTEGKESVSGTEAHLREGVVVCPVTERRDARAGRVKLKSVSEAYLTRKGGTEHN